MADKTKSVDGKEHPASDFAAVGDANDPNTWHLPIFDAKHAKLARDMFSRTEGMSPETKKKAKARIQAAAKKHGVDTTNFADFNNGWIEIFHTGDYGDKGNWDRDDLDDVVANFSAGVWTPPAVFGHPKEDDPAHGWVCALERVGDVLRAKFNQVSDELEASVKNGRFPNRSAAFYRDPKGNGPALRHVGFLGATPPEVKGLEPISFSDADFVDIDFDEEDTMDLNERKKLVMDGIKEFFTELLGGEKNRGSNAATFTEEQVQERITKSATELETRLETKFNERLKKAEDQLASGTDQALRAKARAFVEKMKVANKWVPAFSEMGLDVVLEDLAVSGRKIKFGEAGKEKEEMSFDRLCAFLEAQHAIVPKGTITLRNAKGRVIPINFNESRHVSLDQTSVLIEARAREIAKEEKVSFGEALIRARREVPAGATEAGGIAVGQS